MGKRVPFVLLSPAVVKLDFIDRLIAQARGAGIAGSWSLLRGYRFRTRRSISLRAIWSDSDVARLFAVPIADFRGVTRSDRYGSLKPVAKRRDLPVGSLRKISPPRAVDRAGT